MDGGGNVLVIRLTCHFNEHAVKRLFLPSSDDFRQITYYTFLAHYLNVEESAMKRLIPEHSNEPLNGHTAASPHPPILRAA